MSLIQDNQRESAQEPQPKPAPLPRLAPTAGLQEFEQRTGSLQLEQESLVPEPQPLEQEQEQAPAQEVEFAAPGFSSSQESVVGLTRYMGGQLGASPPVQLPQVPAASAPPLTSLWKDAAVDLGIPNLSDERLINTAYPTSYRTPLTSGFDPGVNRTFAAGAQALGKADAANDQALATAARQAQDSFTKRGNLPNVPDASKPWHQQLWGWTEPFLFGSQEERKQEEDTGKGSFGAYGSGLGGFFKSVFGVPIAASTAAFLETWGRDEYKMQMRGLNISNKTVRTERVLPDGKRMSVQVPFKELSAEEKHKYVTEVVSNRLPLGTGNLVRTNVDFRRAFGSFLYDAFAGEVNDSINDANPNLAPVVDKRTGKPAVPKKASGLLQSANLRPGQEWYEDPGGAALSLATQLFSPGNKVDAAGELIGLGIRSIAKTQGARAVGRAVANAVPKPVKKAVGAAAGAAKRTVQSVAQGNFGNLPQVAPISQATPIVAVPLSPAARNLNNNLTNIQKGNSSAPTRPVGYARDAADPDVAVGVQAWRSRNTLQWQPPVVPNVPAFKPQQTPYAPKTDPEGTAIVVGLGQKGEPLEFEPSVALRTHQELVEQVLSQNPDKFGSYKGTTWAEWNEWKKTNLGEEDLRQLEAVGASEAPTKLQSDTTLQPKAPATVDDLQEQARVLVEQKLSIDAPLARLEQVFDETVDVGRRSVDELPLRPLTEDDVAKALTYGSSLRLSRQLPPNLVEAAAKGNYESFLSQVEAYGGVPSLVEAHNRLYTDLSPRVTEALATSKLASEVPPVVYHGTALEQWQPYNVVETGSRGELGSALYTTRSYDEARLYSQATVGNNRPPEIAYDPIAPQVVELNTSGLRATLDASAPWTKEEAEEFFSTLPQLRPAEVEAYSSFADLTRAVEYEAASKGGSEDLLQSVNDSIADTLRSRGYDSVYDPRSGWLAVVDNGKVGVVKQEYAPEPSAVQAAVARYNADSLAAGHYPDHLTSDANLRDSAFQVLDTARNQLDEKLEEVQQQLAEASYKEEPPSVAEVAKALTHDELRAAAKEPPSVDRYMRDIRQFGQPLHPVVLRELPFGTGERVGYEVVANVEAYAAALASYSPRTYNQVSAVVLGQDHALVDIRTIRKTAQDRVQVPSTKEEVLKELKPDYTTAPVVLEQTSFGTYRILDRGYTANAFNRAKQAQVPSVVVGLDGKATYKLVDLAAIEKKAKALEPKVPKVQEVVEQVSSTKPDAPETTTLSYRDLQKKAKELGLSAKGKKQELVQRLLAQEDRKLLEAVVVEPTPARESTSLEDLLALRQTIDPKEAAEMGGSIDEALEANPHATLREALDDTQDGGLDSCKF